MEAQETQNDLIKESQEKYEELLRKYKVRRIAYLLNHKARLEEQIKQIDTEIQGVSNIVAIPEGERFSD